jgi:hypothetical protein
VKRNSSPDFTRFQLHTRDCNKPEISTGHSRLTLTRRTCPAKELKMKYQTVKSVREVNIEGHTIELDRTDDSLNAVTIMKNGQPVLRIVMRSYNLYCERPAEPKQVEKFKVTGTIAGIPVEKTFDKHSDAYTEKMRLEDAVITGSSELEVETVVVADEEDLPF